jgi:hypothetical protein
MHIPGFTAESSLRRDGGLQRQSFHQEVRLRGWARATGVVVPADGTTGDGGTTQTGGYTSGSDGSTTGTGTTGTDACPESECGPAHSDCLKNCWQRTGSPAWNRCVDNCANDYLICATYKC